MLCGLAARGNAAAYDVIYRRYRVALVAFASHVLGRAGSPEDAEDIAQDTFIRAFAALREKRVEGSFKSWLYTIARNRSYDLLRSRRQHIISLDSDELSGPAALPHTEPAVSVERRAELAWLVTALGDLPERQRDALLLKEMGGLSHARIANELGTTVSATKKLIGRGRDQIDRAAEESGYRRGRRRLGRDLALAAPVVPLTMSIGLGSLGTAGSAGAAFGQAAAGVGGAGAGGAGLALGKTFATVLTVAAIGGGSVAVENQNRGERERPKSVVAEAPQVSGAGTSAAQPTAVGRETSSDRSSDSSNTKSDTVGDKDSPSASERKSRERRQTDQEDTDDREVRDPPAYRERRQTADEAGWPRQGGSREDFDPSARSDDSEQPDWSDSDQQFDERDWR